MDKPKINYIVDALIFVSFIITSLTGLAIFFFMPEGVRQGGYQEFLGITKHTWSEVHNWVGIAMIVLALVHLLLHYAWIACMSKSFFVRKKK